ncbi:MAG TPA: hypothetical protein VEV83_08070 [Parafilimonas sp.]|nr:hypothetical protein [Parafilimonas sp.]
MAKVYPSNKPFSFEFDDEMDGLDNNKNRSSYKQDSFEDSELFHSYWLLTIQMYAIPDPRKLRTQGTKTGGQSELDR